MLSGQQKHKNAYDMITLRIRNTMEFYRFLNEEKKKKWEKALLQNYVYKQIIKSYKVVKKMKNKESKRK